MAPNGTYLLTIYLIMLLKSWVSFIQSKISDWLSLCELWGAHKEWAMSWKHTTMNPILDISWIRAIPCNLGFCWLWNGLFIRAEFTFFVDRNLGFCFDFGFVLIFDFDFGFLHLLPLQRLFIRLFLKFSKTVFISFPLSTKVLKYFLHLSFFFSLTILLPFTLWLLLLHSESTIFIWCSFSHCHLRKKNQFCVTNQIFFEARYCL